MKKIFIGLFYILLLLTFNTSIYALENKSYSTIVHPVRGRDLWQNIKFLEQQIDTITKHRLPATWLIQYKVLDDAEVLDRLKNLPQNHEIGIFLEIDEKLADDSLVPYLHGDGDWARADKVLLSGYSPPERKRMIDRVFEKFYKTFGFYPVSVGAWYIDTFSLNYLAEKYKIQAVLEVADQYQTDTYGLWGKPWGVPYFPSKINSLVPASGKDRLGVVKIQWAARDLVRGYGLNVADSTYSIQANDYIGHHKLDSSYFKKLINDYLFSLNPLTHLTVGIEVGQEGNRYQTEYQRQIDYLSELQNKRKVSVQTMKDFASIFENTFHSVSPDYFMMGEDIYDPNMLAFWYSNDFYRINLVKDKDDLKIMDFRLYDKNTFYRDTFKKDTNQKLQRIIPAVIDDLLMHNGKVLMEKISIGSIERNKDEVIINLLDDKNNNHFLTLTQKMILLDMKPIIEIIDKETLKEKAENLLGSLLLKYELLSPHGWKGDIRFSSIDNVYYAGFWYESDRIVGIRSKWPFMGIFKFPYQTLARFKTIDRPNIFNLVSDYFINYLNHSTIKSTTIL